MTDTLLMLEQIENEHILILQKLDKIIALLEVKCNEEDA